MKGRQPRPAGPTQTRDTTAQLAASLGDWYLALNPTYHDAPFQQEQIVPALEHLARRHGKRKLLIEVPPGHAKTDLATKHFIPHYLGNHPGHSAMTLSYSDDLSKMFGRAIKNVCNDPIAQSVFPGLALTRDSRANSFFATVQGNDYYAVGFDGTIAGRRVDLLGIDDPVKNKVQAESETIMSSHFDVYRSVVKSRLKPNGLMFMALTRYGLRDFAARVLESEGAEWDILSIPAEDAEGHYLWEEHYGRAHYESAKRDEEVWWATYMQRPKAFTENYFREEWLCFSEPGAVKGAWGNYMICDPALAQTRKANRTSIVVVAAGPERRIFLRDWVYDRLDPDQRADACCRLVRKWQPRRFLYEEFGLTADTFYLGKRFKQEGIALRPISTGRRGPRAALSKDDRIKELRSDFRDGLIWFPKSLKQTCVDGTTIDVIRTFLDEEYLPYRGPDSVPRDDGLDTLSRLHDPELRLEYVPEADPAERRRDDRRGSWEAYY